MFIKFNANCEPQWGDSESGTPDYLLWRDENRGLGAHAKAIAVDVDENIYVAGDSYTNYWFDDVYTDSWWPAWDVATVQYFKTDQPFPVDVFAQCVEHFDGKIAVDIIGGPFADFGTVTPVTSYIDEGGTMAPVLGLNCSISNWEPPGVTNVYWENTQIKAFCDICPAGVVVETNRGGRGESTVQPLPLSREIKKGHVRAVKLGIVLKSVPSFRK
jgi:hypothetical protein